MQVSEKNTEHSKGQVEFQHSFNNEYIEQADTILIIFGCIFIKILSVHHMPGIRLPRWLSGKEPVCQYRRHKRLSLILGSGSSPGGGHGNPLQYSCLGNPMDGRAWWATVHRVTKSWTQWKRFSMQVHSCQVLFWDLVAEGRTEQTKNTCFHGAHILAEGAR